MILLIDTSSPGIGLGLWKTGASVMESAPSRAVKLIPTEKQSVSLPIETEKFLKENNAAFEKVSALGVIVGPGSFTGIRLGIAYAKGLALGLNAPVVPISRFEIYLHRDPDAFVALESGRGDFFVAAKNINPCVMTIDEVEARQMEYPKTVGHNRHDLADAIPVALRKLSAAAEPVTPMYLKPSYAEQTCKSS